MTLINDRSFELDPSRFSEQDILPYLTEVLPEDFAVIRRREAVINNPEAVAKQWAMKMAKDYEDIAAGNDIGYYGPYFVIGDSPFHEITHQAFADELNIGVNVSEEAEEVRRDKGVVLMRQGEFFGQGSDRQLYAVRYFVA